MTKEKETEPELSKTLRVRLSVPGDFVQEMFVDEKRNPAYTGEKGEPKTIEEYVCIVDTGRRRPDFERRRTHKQHTDRVLGVTFMKMHKTNDRLGRPRKVGLRDRVVDAHGHPLPWEEADVIRNAVEAMDVPRDMLYRLRQWVNSGWLVVEDTPVEPENAYDRTRPAPPDPEAPTATPRTSGTTEQGPKAPPPPPGK